MFTATAELILLHEKPGADLFCEKNRPAPRFFSAMTERKLNFNSEMLIPQVHFCHLHTAFISSLELCAC